MMESREYFNSLFDIYKELLTKKEQETFKEHYVEDLSMQEIADNLNVSKSGVGMTVKRAEEKLKHYESILHIYEERKMIMEALEEEDINTLKDILKKVLENEN